MPSTTLDYKNDLYNAYTPNYSGVVRIVDYDNSIYGSGSLLYDGKAILTAAHLLQSDPSQLKILFEENEHNSEYRYSSNYLSFYSYNMQSTGSNDLAILWLDTPAPSFARRYDIYRDNPLGKEFNFSGYGAMGVGESGIDENFETILRIQAYNKFEAYYSDMQSSYSNSLELVADFDSGTQGNNTLSVLIDSSDLGLGDYEGMLLSGDSGSPAWIDQKIAGVAKGIAKYGIATERPYGSFGDIGVWSDTSELLYQQWIDQNLRANYRDAPSSKDEVKTTILEGSEGDTSYTYFLVEFIGTRDHEEELLSIDYTTRDDSAVAGVDYIKTSGRLILYPDEYNAVIPVEIIGNNMPQEDRSFFLDIYNPIGGSFGGEVEILSASRTIIDDDPLFIA